MYILISKNLVEFGILVIQHHDVLLQFLQFAICGHFLQLQLLPCCFLFIQLLLQILIQQSRLQSELGLIPLNILQCVVQTSDKLL